MNYIISIEGQTINVPENIGSSDQAVRAALAPVFPEVTNALITRVTEGEITTIAVVKKAGTKGVGPVAYLVACKGGQNPAIELFRAVEEFTQRDEIQPFELMEMDTKIEAVIAEGKQQGVAIEHAVERLKEAIAQPARIVVEGF